MKPFSTTAFACFWILFGIGQILRKLGAPWVVEWSMYTAMAEVFLMEFRAHLFARTKHTEPS